MSVATWGDPGAPTGPAGPVGGGFKRLGHCGVDAGAPKNGLEIVGETSDRTKDAN